MLVSEWRTEQLTLHNAELSRRAFLTGCSILVADAILGSVTRTEASQGSTSTEFSNANLIADLVVANHILADQGVLDGYGHVSARHDGDPHRYFLSRSLAPELVTAADIMEFDLDNNAVDPRGRAIFIERFIYGEIYKARPDVAAIVHSHSPSVIPFGVSTVPLRPLYHMAAFMGDGVSIFDIRKVAGMTDMLVRTPKLGTALTQILGPRAAVLMRGHGVVVVGKSLPEAVGRSVYLEINARLQAQAIALGGKIEYLDPEEARKSGPPDDYERAWELWKRRAMIK
jgi:ribulose-5-phosphate 4-epimerase/fuculose-1-phosphate aldolase